MNLQWKLLKWFSGINTYFDIESSVNNLTLDPRKLKSNVYFLIPFSLSKIKADINFKPWLNFCLAFRLSVPNRFVKKSDFIPKTGFLQLFYIKSI